MKLASIIVAAALTLATQAVSAEPRGLSLQDAQTLPASALRERVLGAVGALYTEIERPSPTITRGRAFVLEFASAPRSAGYPGLCEADTIIVNFGPSADRPATSIANVQSAYRGTVYRIVGDTAPQAGGWTDADSRMLTEQCSAAGPVLSQPGRAQRFFRGHYYAGGFWSTHAYFGARVLAMASSSASPPVQCRDYIARPGDNVCDDPAALLRNPPMERFLGFRIDRCGPDATDLCVTADFSRGSSPDSRSIAIRMRTSLSEPSYPPREFALREIRITASEAIS
jgi:hypothetical protein